MVITPAGVDEGIVFVRTDLKGNNRIKADVHNVRDTTLATTLGLNGVTVSTVEHLMSAFSGMGVDNAVVEVDAPEIPIMDGSARPFVEMLKDVGTQVQGKCKKLLVIKKKVCVSEGESTAMLLPAPEFRITYKIDFSHPSIGVQTYDMKFSDISYEKEICAARTFGFLKDVEYMQAKGLALGGSLKNAVVLDEQRIINKEGLRCPGGIRQAQDPRCHRRFVAFGHSDHRSLRRLQIGPSPEQSAPQGTDGPGGLLDHGQPLQQGRDDQRVGFSAHPFLSGTRFRAGGSPRRVMASVWRLGHCPSRK